MLVDWYIYQSTMDCIIHKQKLFDNNRLLCIIRINGGAMMVKFHNCNITSPETAVIAYPAIGSLDQIVEGVLVKSKQHDKLRGKEWIVILTNHENRTEQSLCVCDGKII